MGQCGKERQKRSRALCLLRPVVEGVKAMAELSEDWNDARVGHQVTYVQLVLDKGLRKGETMFLILHQVFMVT